MWTPEDAQRYLRNNLDVLREYERNPQGMSPSVFAQRHYENYGKAEGRKSGAELDPRAKQPGVSTAGLGTPEERAQRNAEVQAQIEAIRAKPREARTREESQLLADFSKAEQRRADVRANGGISPATPESQKRWAEQNPDSDLQYLGAKGGNRVFGYKPGMNPAEVAAAAEKAQLDQSQQAFAESEARRGYQNLQRMFGDGVDAYFDAQGNRRAPQLGMNYLSNGYIDQALAKIDQYDPDGKFNPFGDVDYRAKVKEYSDWAKSVGATKENNRLNTSDWYRDPQQVVAEGNRSPLNPKPAGGVIAEKISPPRPQVTSGQAGPLGTRQSGIINERMKDSTRWR